MTPLERAARAHYSDAWGGQPFHDWDDIDENERQSHRRAARAVLTAIREPSEAMKKAGAFCELFLTKPGEVWTPGQIVAHTCYQAMIDAALKEG